jgi:hypothetical protein
MKNLEKLISPLVESHFPEFYKEDGPRFVDFVTQYFKWMESDEQAIYWSRNLLDIKDIDKTSPEFIKYYKQKYLSGIPLESSANTQMLVKHSQDLYTAKGTSKSIEAVIQGLFNQEATVYFPGTDIFKTSHGTWVQPVYLELSVSERTKTYVGKEIVGSNSGSKAFMESLVRRRVGTKFIEVAYLSNLRGDFITGERITTTANIVLEDAPSVIGSMTSLTVVTGGANFAIGDLFTVESENGKQGLARVTEISNETGKVSFLFVDALTSGGWGYSLDHANVIISSKVLTLTNIGNSNSSITTYQRFEGVTQRLANVGYTIATGNNANFEIGNVVENFNLDGTVNANGIIVATSKTTSNTGFIIVSPDTGNLVTIDSTFAVRALNASSASFNASLVGPSLITTTAAHTFSNNILVRYHVLTGNTQITELSTGAAYYVVNAVSGTSTLQLANTFGGGAISLTAGSSQTGHQLIETLGTAAISTYADRTASGNVVGSNTTLSTFSFNANSAVANATNIITLESNHTLVNNNIVRYVTATGNTAVSGLTTGDLYYVVNAAATTVQLSTTRAGSAISLTSGLNESGHSLHYRVGFLGVADLSSNNFLVTPYANVVGYLSNTTSVVANVSTGTGAGFLVSLLTDTENVFLTPDFLSSNNTGNIVFHSVLLNGFNANTTATGYGVADTFNPSSAILTGTAGTGVLFPTSVQFNANSGVANTTDIITTSTAHVFGNNEQVTYSTHPSNTVITGLANNTTYYVVNAIASGLALQLSTTSGGSPIDITANSSSSTATGHFLARAGTTGTNNAIAFSNAINYSPNTAIRYFIATGNTVVSGLTTNTVYYVDQSNATHVALKATPAGSRIALTVGSNETGHSLVGPLRILSTSEIQHKGLGFVKFPGTNMDTILLDALRFDATVIGSIAAIAGLNPGAEYNIDPFVVVHDTYVAGYDKHDYLMEISSPSGAFIDAEQIQQTYNSPATQLTVNTFSGTFANGTSSTTFVQGEFVYQSNSTINVAASGFVLESGISAGSGTLKLRDVTGTFLTTTSTNTLIRGLSSGSTSNAQAAAITTFATTARAIVKPGSNTSTLKLKRINLENTFIVGSTIIGRSSGTTATVSVVDQDLTTLPVGLNADITANVQTANNVVNELSVYDSGFGYINQETVTLTKADSTYVITAIAQLSKQGYGAGFFSSSRGFLDEDKKLQDNDYYQNYSYEVQTKIPFDKYIEVLKKITHVAGTKAFGRVNTLSTVNTAMTIINSIDIS